MSKWWAAAFAAPVAAAAFWGTSTQSNNDVETLLKDAESFEKAAQDGDAEEAVKFALKMISSVRGMPDSELLKHPEFVPEVLSVLVSFLASIEHPEAAPTVELLYTVARRMDAENKYPEVLRAVYRADFVLKAAAKQIPEAKRLLMMELDLVRKLEKTNTSMEQSDLLFALSVLAASDGDANASKYLEESNKVFNGVTSATLSSELENYWRMSILNQLQFAVSCDEEGDADMAKIFRTSSRSLYDTFKKVSPNKKNIPEFRELEVYAKMAVKQRQEQGQ